MMGERQTGMMGKPVAGRSQVVTIILPRGGVPGEVWDKGEQFFGIGTEGERAERDRPLIGGRRVQPDVFPM